MARNARSVPWLPTMDSPAHVTHAAKLVIVAQTTLFVDVTRAVIPCVVMKTTVEDITLIVAKEIVTLTIVKVTEVRAQEVRTHEARAKEVRATKETSMEVAVKEMTSIVSDSQIMAATIGATRGQHLPPDITTVINLTMQTFHRTTTSSTAPLQPLWPRNMLATNSTRRQLWSIPVPRGTCSTIYPSSTNSSLSHPRLSSWATTRQPTVLRLVWLCSTCLTGVVSAFLRSFMCPASPSTS
jgi:hypothetical protein